MRIEHIAVYVLDLEKMRSFYGKYFGGVSNRLYENPVSGLRTYFLSFSGGARLELMSRPGIIEENKPALQQGPAHLAFDVGSREEVDRLTGILQKDGYAITRQSRITGDGYYESVILDPEGNQVEITSD